MLNVGFTYAGVQRLWPGRDAELKAAFPQAFREGPAIRAADNGDDGGSAPEHWLFGAGSAAHGMLSVFADDEGALQAKAAELSTQLAANGLAVLHGHDAGTLPNGEIPFKFRDGIAEPRIAGRCGKRDDMQPAASPGEFLLGGDYRGIYGGDSLGPLPADIAANGSFCAVRLIEQDPDAFEAVLEAAAGAGAAHEAERELVAAKLMGRWRDGTPLSLRPTITDWVGSGGADKDRNDFDYTPSYEYPGTIEDHDGARCPVTSHVRRTNPRSARIAGARHSRRLIRRGMPSEWQERNKSRVGLFGVFHCASLERQF